MTFLPRLASCFSLLVGLLLCPVPTGAAAGDPVLRVAVLDNSPPMAFIDAQGQRNGFSVSLMRALCEEMRVTCQFSSTTLERVVEVVAAGQVDVAAVNLLDTPERRARVLFSRPVFRSRSIWLAPVALGPESAGITVAVVQGSAQAAYAQTQSWRIVPVKANGELTKALLAGDAQAALAPMPTVLGMLQQPGFERLGLVPRVLPVAELGGNVGFAVSPERPAVKVQIDAALDRVKRDGRYDRINSEFLPFRID